MTDQPTATDERVGRLEEILRSVESRSSIRHAIMAVESGDGSFRWHGAGGMTNGSPATPDQPFYIASIDKLYNATIALRLSEDGRLHLDESITAYLPDEITKSLHVMGGRDYTPSITVRHLLAHASGIAEWLEDAPKGERSLFERIVEEGDREISLQEIAMHVRDRLKPHFPPQDLSGPRPKVRYCDTNYILLVHIIEVVAGRPLHEVHADILIEPLDLRSTFFLGRTEPRDATPPPTPLRADGEPLDMPLILRSINSIYSTASDSIAFLRGLIEGRVFRNPETLQMMQANWNRFGFPRDRAALRAPSWPIEYGLGIKRFRLPRLLTPLRPVPAVVGHTGSTGAWLFHCAELDLYLSGSVDEVTAGAVPYRLVPRILAILGS